MIGSTKQICINKIVLRGGHVGVLLVNEILWGDVGRWNRYNEIIKLEL